MNDEKVKKTYEEDSILFIFIVLFILKLYSNAVERNYRINYDINCRKRYHYINEFTFIVAGIIYLYYVYCNCCEEKINYLTLFANIMSLVIVVIFVYFEIVDDD